MDKPIDILDDSNKDQLNSYQSIQKDKERAEAIRVQELFKASYNAKYALGLPEKWRTFDDYKHNRQIQFAAADDPMSQTNIIHPIIESQVADLVGKPYAVIAKGTEASDDRYAAQVEHMMKFVLTHNKFKTKVNMAEHDRLELGTAVFKVYFDEDRLGGKGLPVFEPISPANFFPDPKIQAAHLLQEGEFVIHAVPRPLSYFKQRYDNGEYVQRQLAIPYDPAFEGDTASFTDHITANQALCIECYRKDEDGNLYRVTVANDVLLEDTRETGEKVQRRDMYPFVAVPCYVQRGMIWGQGDVELLIPTQDLINELDDMIRINARMMGNPQIVIGQGAGNGFDFRKWTSKSGLRIPMRDAQAFRVVEARPISPDVVNRREKAFEESDIISGRYNVNRGESPGQITAASAITALQQAGQKTVVHKQNLFKEAFSDVLALLYDEMLSNWTKEMWIRVEGTEPDYEFVDPTKLTQITQLIPNALAGMDDDTLKELTDEDGMKMTRDAQFDFTLSMGDGLPEDKTFIHQTFFDVAPMQFQGMPVLSWDEVRKYLRENVGMSLDNDENVKANLQPPPPMIPGMMPPDGGAMI